MASVESVINGRFQIIAAGSLPAPGNCCVCGSVERDCVDFGLNVDYFGAVLLCFSCLGQASEVAGLQAPAQPTPLYPNVDGGTINDYVRSATDAINRLRTLLPPDADIRIGLITDDEVIPSDAISEPIGDTADIKVDGSGADESVKPSSQPFKF